MEPASRSLGLGGNTESFFLSQLLLLLRAVCCSCVRLVGWTLAVPRRCRARPRLPLPPPASPPPPTYTRAASCSAAPAYPPPRICLLVLGSCSIQPGFRPPPSQAVSTGAGGLDLVAGGLVCRASCTPSTPEALVFLDV